jgi:hypothetical protein
MRLVICYIYDVRPCFENLLIFFFYYRQHHSLSVRNILSCAVHVTTVRRGYTQYRKCTNSVFSLCCQLFLFLPSLLHRSPQQMRPYCLALPEGGLSSIGETVRPWCTSVHSYSVYPGPPVAFGPPPHLARHAYCLTPTPPTFLHTVLPPPHPPTSQFSL